MRPLRTTASRPQAALVALAALALAVSFAGCGSQSQRYVALGDSFSAGMGIYPRATYWTPSECQQSVKSYPHIMYEALGFSSFADGACAGAVVADMHESQRIDKANVNAPQFNLLNGKETLVTLSIGGNDAGFWGTALSCFQNTDPAATPCRNKFLVNGENLLTKRTDEKMPAVAQTIRDIRKRSPNAKIMLVGYQQIAPADGKGCAGYIPASQKDLIFFNDWEKYLNQQMAQTAKAEGVGFVDAYGASVGHDACNPRAVRWVEPMINYEGIIKLHPNADGEQALANQVMAAIDTNK